jgi:hypothetical protein
VMAYTSREVFESGYTTLQSSFASGRTKSIKWRKASESWLARICATD